MSCDCQHDHTLTHNEELNRDPTRTTTLRKKFIQDLNKRNRDVRGTLRKAIVDLDVMGLTKDAPDTRDMRLRGNIDEEILRQIDEYEFARSPEKLDEFGDFVDNLTDSNYITTRTGPARPTVSGQWTDKYISSAYKTGVKQADQKMRREISEKGLRSQMPPSTDVNYQAVLQMPVHSQKLQLLYSRTFRQLEGITSGMEQQINRVMAEGIAQGKGPIQIAKQISSEVKKIHTTRSAVMARTEIINAHAEATLDRFEQIGVEEVRGKAEFSTAGDMRVCPICSSLEGEIMPISEARGLIPVHANCRCSFLPNISEPVEFNPGLFP